MVERRVRWTTSDDVDSSRAETLIITINSRLLCDIAKSWLTVDDSTVPELPAASMNSEVCRSDRYLWWRAARITEAVVRAPLIFCLAWPNNLTDRADFFYIPSKRLVTDHVCLELFLRARWNTSRKRRRWRPTHDLSSICGRWAGCDANVSCEIRSCQQASPTALLKPSDFNLLRGRPLPPGLCHYWLFQVCYAQAPREPCKFRHSVDSLIDRL